ncbi:MAG: leucine-rich repeat domain-containing protein [Clostridia bacterium]|nr:leucine-rich repeat domain-containing protein [Clostridia bacterium]
MKNKLISLLLAAIMIVTLIPGTAFAKTYGGEFDSASADPNGNKYICTWIFDEASATLYVEGVGSLPEMNASAQPWSAHSNKIVNLVIEEGITTIGKRGFCNLKNLKSVSIPSSVTAIQMRAFEYCTGLESITIPGTVSSLQDQVFNGCTGLKTVVFEDGIDSLGCFMFGSCTSLEDVYVYGMDTSISRMRSNTDDGVWFRGCNFDILTAHCYPGSDADDYFTNDIYTITNWSNDREGNEKAQSYEKKENSMVAGGYTLKVEYITE